MSDSIPSASDFGAPISRRGDRQEMSNLSKLPAIAAVTHPVTGAPVIVTRGFRGYSEIVNPVPVDELNKAFGVTKAQAAAMLAGSMFGFDAPAANPDMYDDEGNMKK